MGFASGSITFRRYYLCGEHPGSLSEEWFEALAGHAFGQGGEETSDGIESGWIVPTHLFDVDFSAPQRVTVGRFVYLAMRLDRTAAPAPIVKSYRKQEEEAALAASGGEVLGRAERSLARQAAADRAQREARKGMFRRVAAYPVLIDLEDGVVYFGNTGSTAGDKLLTLFSDTFQTTLAPATIEEAGYRIAERIGASRSFDEATPAHFADPPAMDGEIASAEFPGNDRRFLGREFLTWLWYRTDAAEGLFELDGDRSVALSIHRMMHLECGYNLTGRDSIVTEAPARSPEAWAALGIGKQPTKVALLIGADQDEWSLSLDGPAWNVSGLVLPPPEESDPLGRLEERFNGMRRVGRTLDQLLAVFLRCRLGAAWKAESAAIRAWVPRGRNAEQTPLQRASA